jgi:hypothetical protein
MIVQKYPKEVAMNEYPASLHAERLMAHMRVVCQEIGPRPATSIRERQAADYVEKTLQQLNVPHIQRQMFKSQNSSGWLTLPCFAAGALAAPLASLGGRWGKLAGGLLLLGSAFTFAQGMFTQPPVFQKLVARGASQNIIARIPARGRARRTVYVVGHFDSQKQRFQFPPPQPEIAKAQSSLPLVIGTLAGLGLLLEAWRGGKAAWIWAPFAAYLWGIAGAAYDETQPHIEGANDNATALSVLLGIAEALKAQPLQTTDVVLLFTGCEEVGCVGMEHYLEQFAPPLDSTYWIDIEMVGTGNLCYVTRHGVTYLTPYTPHPEMVELAAQAAHKHPELKVIGKDMLIIEEISNLWRRGYKSVCIAGYNAKGFLPNWHRLSDNLSNIEPETLARAAHYTWALMQEVDGLS